MPYCQQSQNSIKFEKSRNFANFHAMTQNLKSLQNFSIDFSEASPLHNLKVHVKMWGWTRGKPKRPTGSGAQAQKATKKSA